MSRNPRSRKSCKSWRQRNRGAKSGINGSMTLSLTTNQRDLLVLRLVPRLGPRLTGALLERFGSPGAVLAAAPEELRDVPYLGEKLARDLHRAIQNSDVDKELALIEKHGVGLIDIGSAGYPPALAEIHDPPALLYVRG